MHAQTERRYQDRRKKENRRVEAILKFFTPVNQERRSGEDRRRAAQYQGKRK